MTGEWKALTLTQPWASLVAIGAKSYETRGWSTGYRGPLAIHAAKGLGSVGGGHGLLKLCKQEPFASALAPLAYDLEPSESPWRLSGGRGLDLPLGVIVAVCELEDIYPVAECVQRLRGSNEIAFGDFSAGRYAWRLANVIRLEHPIEARGALGLWTPQPHVAAYCQGIRAARDLQLGKA